MKRRRCRRSTRAIGGALALQLLLAWSAGAEPPSAAGPRPTVIDPPAPPGSTSPAIASELPTPQSAEHDLLLTWLAPGAAGGKLMFGRFSGGTWFPPVTIAEPVAMLGPTDVPSLTVIDTQGVRRTLIARTGDVVARSGDGGRTWGRLPAAPLPFSSFAGGDEGGYAFWPLATANGAAKLLGTRILAGETVLDSQIASGVPTAAAMTWDSPVVAYRDRDAAGALSIAVIRRQGGAWTAPQTLLAERWRPTTMPKHGPAVATHQRSAVIAWTTGTPPHARLLLAFSADAGQSFGAPIEVDAGDGERSPVGPVALAMESSAETFVTWTVSKEGGPSAIYLARVAADGKRSREFVLAQAPPAHLWGVPQIVSAGERLAVTWIEGVLARVRAALLPRADIPPALEKRVAPASSGAPRPYRGHGRQGDLAPELELQTLTGERVSLSSLRGRVVLLNLWATWCAPCVAEMPELAALEARYGSKGLTVVGVNVDDAGGLAKVRAFVAERKLPFAVWLDPAMNSSRDLRVQALPTSFLIDRDGRISLRREQPLLAGDVAFEEALRRILE